MPSVYIETTVISYLSSRPSNDVIVAGHQKSTHEWWNERRHLFELHASQVVYAEAAAGDPLAAQRRLALLDGIPLLEITHDCAELARAIIAGGALPRVAQEDALHIAIAATHGMDYLLSWNCTHIANAEIYRAVSRICNSRDVEAPIICTPDGLMGETDDEGPDR